MVKYGWRERRSYSRIREVLDLPNLIEIQQKSYEWFLEEGLREMFAGYFSDPGFHGKPGAGVYRL